MFFRVIQAKDVITDHQKMGLLEWSLENTLVLPEIMTAIVLSPGKEHPDVQKLVSTSLIFPDPFSAPKHRTRLRSGFIHATSTKGASSKTQHLAPLSRCLIWRRKNSTEPQVVGWKVS